MKGRRIKQINNLTIYYTTLYSAYTVWTPDGRCWEQFDTLQDAESFCKKTHDFIRR